MPTEAIINAYSERNQYCCLNSKSLSTTHRQHLYRQTLWVDKLKKIQHVLGIMFVMLSGTGKPRNWKCEACDKAYIGRAGLARHYRMKPSHGKLDNEPGKLL